jgi:hypothetical protein
MADIFLDTLLLPLQDEAPTFADACEQYASGLMQLRMFSTREIAESEAVSAVPETNQRDEVLQRRITGGGRFWRKASKLSPVLVHLRAVQNEAKPENSMYRNYYAHVLLKLVKFAEATFNFDLLEFVLSYLLGLENKYVEHYTKRLTDAMLFYRTEKRKPQTYLVARLSKWHRSAISLRKTAEQNMTGFMDTLSDALFEVYERAGWKKTRDLDKAFLWTFAMSIDKNDERYLVGTEPRTAYFRYHTMCLFKRVYTLPAVPWREVGDDVYATLMTYFSTRGKMKSNVENMKKLAKRFQVIRKALGYNFGVMYRTRKSFQTVK